MTADQLNFIGIIAKLSLNQPTTYTNRFNKNTPIMTDTKSISFDEVYERKQFADFVERGSVGRTLNINGYNTGSITPAIIDADIVLTAEELGKVEAGKVVILQGKALDSGARRKEEKLAILNQAVANTQELINGSVFATGTYTMPKTNKKVDFGFSAATTVTWGTNNELVQLVYDAILSYQNDNGFIPTAIQFGTKIVRKALADTQFQDAVFKFGGKVAGLTSVTGGLPIANILGVNIETLPPCFDSSNKNIMPDDTIYIVNDTFLIPAYAGLEYIGDSGNPEMIAADMIVDFETTRRSASTTVWLKKAYTPFVALAEKAVKRIKVAGL